MAMDESNIKQMPHSLEAEQAVLGSIMIDESCIPQVVGAVKPDDFYVTLNRSIFETVLSMFSYSKKIDPITVISEMKTRGESTEGTSDYLIKLMEMTPTAANVMEYAKILRDLSLLRQLAVTGSEINTLAMAHAGTAAEILELSEQKIYAIRQGRTNGGLMSVGKVLVGVYKELAEAMKNGNKIPGLSTGLYDLDRAILGLNKSDLILIASRPGMGKTSIALNIALNTAKSTDQTVVIFSLEMSKEQLCMRMLSGESYVDNKKLQTGNLTEEEWRRVASASVVISGLAIEMDDNPVLSVTDMNAACRRVRNLGLVVIDYLQLMQSAGGGPARTGENRTQVVSDISRMLKIMAKELNVPVVCLSQLSRANESRMDKRPMLSDLRESGAIEQDADIVLGLYRDDYYNKESETPNVAECIILKNRRGETGTIQLKWMPEYTTYSSLDTRHEEE